LSLLKIKIILFYVNAQIKLPIKIIDIQYDKTKLRYDVLP